jgi:hypothetical protein
MDLDIIKLYWTGFSIGAGFHISQHKFQKTYDNPQLWNCLCIVVSLSGFSLNINLPLWKEPK